MAVNATQQTPTPVSSMLNVSVVVSGDAYLGEPQMALVVDGQQVGTATVTANHGDGEWQTLTFSAAMSANFQTIGVDFLNDAYGGWAGADRNLYVDHIVVNGNTLDPQQGLFHDTANQTSAGSSSLSSNGTLSWDASHLGSGSATPSGSGSSSGSGSVIGGASGSNGGGAGTPSSTGFFVSTSGSDSNDGSFAHPFASLAQAQSAMEHSSVKTTYVEGGDYYLHDTLNLTAADNGESFLAYQGQTVTVHGGESLSGWTQGANGVWATHVPANLFDSGANGNLDVGGVLQTAARFPDAVPSDPVHGGWLFATGGSNDSIQFNSGDVPYFSNTAGLYVEVFGQRGWQNYLEPVTSIDYNTNTVHLGGSTWDPIGNGSRYFFFNAADQLNAPGEWYYDPAASTISYKPSDPNWNGGNAVAANLSKVFAINGASNVTLGGLTIDGSTNDGVGVDVVHSSNITLEGNHIHSTGTGVHLGGSTQVQIHGNEINNTVGSAIALENGSNYNTVAGNSIHDIGTLQAYSSGISFLGSSNNDFANNTITNVSKSGIAGGSNNGTADASYNNIIEYNTIDHTNLASSDGGGIYIIGTQQDLTGDIVRYNSVSNVTAAGTTTWDGTAGRTFLDPTSKLVSFGIYLDDFASGIQVTGNVLNHNIGGIYIHSGWNNTVTNNVVENGSYDSLVMNATNWTGAGAVASSNNVFDHNIMVADGSTSGASQSGGSLTAASWDHNLYFGAQLNGAPFHIWGTTAPNYANDLAQWQAQGFDPNSQVADPQFVDAAHGNFTLAADSPAHALGFQDIPTAQIGVVGYHAVNSYDLFGHAA